MDQWRSTEVTRHSGLPKVKGKETMRNIEDYNGFRANGTTPKMTFRWGSISYINMYRPPPFWYCAIYTQ